MTPPATPFGPRGPSGAQAASAGPSDAESRALGAGIRAHEQTPPDAERTGEALLALDALTRRLRRECPWDREQDERSIVPHTVEEAYELADAAHSGDDTKLLDELGDVLFQVHFLSLLLEERSAGSLAAVADHCSEKLVRRHPHVFGEALVADAGDVLRNWDEIKRTKEGREMLFGDLPENLPALSRARKAQRRVAATGFDFPGGAGEALRDQIGCVEGAEARDARFAATGDLLFAAVRLAREGDVDPELALRDATRRFSDRVTAAIAQAAAAGEAWPELAPDRQLEHYAHVCLERPAAPAQTPKGGQ